MLAPLVARSYACRATTAREWSKPPQSARTSSGIPAGWMAPRTSIRPSAVVPPAMRITIEGRSVTRPSERSNSTSLLTGQHPKYWTGSADSVANNAEAFVQMAIDEGLPDIGPPISISSHRTEWHRLAQAWTLRCRTTKEVISFNRNEQFPWHSCVCGLTDQTALILLRSPG
jgi:hypothetical protein